MHENIIKPEILTVAGILDCADLQTQSIVQSYKAWPNKLDLMSRQGAKQQTNRVWILIFFFFLLQSFSGHLQKL